MKKSYSPGIYDISNDEYHNSNGISRSGLMLFRKSPLHYWHRYLNDLREFEKQSEAMIFGSALHTAILEPIEFEKRYYILEPCDKRTKIGKESWERQNILAGKREILTESQYKQILAIETSVSTNKNADNLIKGAKYEQSLFWIDKDTNVTCKAKPDARHQNMIVDLKTTNDASYSAFQRSIVEYGYHLQAAFLREASRNVLPNEINNFIFLCVEKDAPHATAIYIIDEKSIDQGERELKKYLSLYKQCLDSNEWNSYNIQEISLPSWAFTNTED